MKEKIPYFMPMKPKKSAAGLIYPCGIYKPAALHLNELVLFKEKL